MTIPGASFLTCPVIYKTPRDNLIDLFGDSCFHVDNSGARTADWHGRLRDVWLHITRRAGLRASAETPHLLHDSQKRPDVKKISGTPWCYFSGKNPNGQLLSPWAMILRVAAPAVPPFPVGKASRHLAKLFSHPEAKCKVHDSFERHCQQEQ